jgi:hypothetical protein
MHLGKLKPAIPTLQHHLQWNNATPGSAYATETVKLTERTGVDGGVLPLCSLKHVIFVAWIIIKSERWGLYTIVLRQASAFTQGHWET